MDKFELKQLRDFVRGKGRGSISKVLHNFDENTELPDIDLSIPDTKFNRDLNDDLVDLGAQVFNTFLNLISKKFKFWFSFIFIFTIC